MTATQHLAFNCRDRKAQEEFYSKHFGFRRARVFNAGKADEFAMLRLGGVCLELFQAPPSTEPGKALPFAQPQTVGFQHLAFEVKDIEAAVAQLHADGVETEQIIDCSWVVPGMKICFLNDPDGNRLELMEGWKDE